VIPRYDVWVRQDGRRWIEVRGRLDCNWFQAMENSVDSAHLQILHQEFVGRGRQPASTTRGFVDDIADFEFELFPLGIWKHRTYVSGEVDSHPLLFPTVLRQGNATQIRVPMDDTHTWHVLVHFEPTADGSVVTDAGDPDVRYARYHKEPADALHPFTRYTMHSVAAQDHMAWETQGPIADRTTEHLAASDRGVVMLRRLVREQIARVQQGLDPLGVIRDPDHAPIDTNLAGEAQGVYTARYPVGVGAATVPVEG
jgi:5,5'-dehydrodivanillate O-demethylase